MFSNKAMNQGNSNQSEHRLDELFHAYRDACPVPETSASFMPEIWARIEAQEVSRNWFGQVAKALVTAALAASVILGMMGSSRNQPNPFFSATYVDAWRADHVSSLEPLDLDRISYMLETQ